MKKQLLVISAVIFAGIGYAGAAASGHEYGKDIEQTAWEGEAFISLRDEAMNAGAPVIEPVPVPVPVNPVHDAAVVPYERMDRSFDRSKITEINAVYQGEYSSYLKILKLELKKAKEVLNGHLEESLNCSNVRLCLTETIKPQGFLAGLFKNKKFKVSLTASCTGVFSNFEFEFYPAFDWDERSDVYIAYEHPRQGPVVKKFTLRGIYKDEFNQAKDSDPSCW